ncbi:MAG: helix-turn-helix transcriptional regulator [Bacilli bacterium]|nr:helix-turn-helix transcriptional regulator [Bacilli bacterium]
MNLDKIGKFIASLRKEKNITQEELAEKLYVTDRAVSKWERGLSMPDASKLIDLCNILGISVNELLIGERVDMKENNKKTEELLIEMAKQEELMNKKLMNNMWVITISSFIFYIALILLACITLEEGFILGVIIFTATLFLLIVVSYGFKIEVDTGYYECKKCHHKFKTTYFKALMAPHMATTRHLRCPKCNQKSWAKKVMSK